MPRSMMRFGVVQGLISTYIHENFDRLEVGAELEGWREIHALANSVDRLVVTESCELQTFTPGSGNAANVAWIDSESRNVSRNCEMSYRCACVSAVLAEQHRRICSDYRRLAVFAVSRYQAFPRPDYPAFQMRTTTRQTSWQLPCASYRRARWTAYGTGM